LTKRHNLKKKQFEKTRKGAVNIFPRRYVSYDFDHLDNTAKFEPFPYFGFLGFFRNFHAFSRKFSYYGIVQNFGN
jgi:hypothetical protein